MRKIEETNNSGSEDKKISEQKKKYVVTSLILLSFAIVVLFGAIAEALINRHPIFEFLQYNTFKPDMIIYGSISLAILYVGILFLGIAACLLMTFEFTWKKILLIPITIGFILILISLGICCISYDWQIKYSIYRYIGLILLLIGVVGRMAAVTIVAINNQANALTYFSDLFKFKLPFSFLVFIGFLLILIADIF